MKLKALLIPMLAAATCFARPAPPEPLYSVTMTMTTYTQNTNYNNGTVIVYGSPVVKTYNTAAILNLLAADKRAQGVWSSSSFPAGSKLAIADSGWVVVDSANDVLADVSDIITNRNGGSAIISGRWSDVTALASPTLKTMEATGIMFNDTAIVGGNNLSFYLQSFSYKTVTDTTPTSAGVYTETATNTITGAGGTGIWSNGAPFFCTGNILAGGKHTYGLTNPTGFAPASLAGYAGTIKISGGPTLAMCWGTNTWTQAGTGSDTNADDYCAGSYTYVKTGPNTASMTSDDIGMLSWLGSSNFVSTSVLFTSPTTALCVFTNKDVFTTASVTLSRAANLAPATLAGRKVHIVGGNTMAYASDGTFTESNGSGVIGSGTYTVTRYSPTGIIIQENYTGGNDAGALSVVEALFTTTTNGRAFYSWYSNPTPDGNPDQWGVATWTLK